MTPHDFAYWLQGFAELNEGPPTEGQWTAIRDHLALVFSKVTPGIPINDPSLVKPFIGSPSKYQPPLRAECSSATILASGDGETRFVPIGKDGW